MTDSSGRELCGVEQPKRIWLMVYRHAGDVCWTSEPNPDDADEIETVEYVRADELTTLLTRVEALTAERDALLQKPLDLAKMDSIDDDIPDKMLAYYWCEQAREARGRVEALEEALRFRPKPSETFAYQADGYAAGWNAAIAQYQANARSALEEPKG